MILADKLATLALLGFLSLPAPAMAGITAQDWGVTADAGRPAKLFTLTNANGMAARISSYGGVVVSLAAPDRYGKFADVVQGFDSLTDYTSADYLKSNGHYGAIVGRFANRIRGAKVTLDGKNYALDPDKDGNLHQGGTMAYIRQVFSAAPKDGPDPSLVLSRTDPDGFMGFPGKVEVTITYTLTRNNALRVDMRATTDKKTVINLINHSYFKLSDAPTVDGETLQVFAHHFTPIDAGSFPTGEIRDVAGCDFDFPKGALDKGYVPHGAMSFQTQHNPDSPNHPNFPSTELAPGQVFHEVTEYRFRTYPVTGGPCFASCLWCCCCFSLFSCGRGIWRARNL